MNKTKIILAGIGGAIGLVVLVLAFLVWQAFSAKTAAIEGDDEEGVDGLETVETRVQGLLHKPVYPSAASVTAVEANLQAVDDWRKEGLSLAVRGDRVYPRTTPAQFKTDIVADAKRLMALPGAAEGRLVKSDFAFALNWTSTSSATPFVASISAIIAMSSHLRWSSARSASAGILPSTM